MRLKEGETVKLPPYVTPYRGTATGDIVESQHTTYEEICIKIPGGEKHIMIDRRDLEVIPALDSKPPAPSDSAH